jgi:hypothetical protein
VKKKYISPPQNSTSPPMFARTALRTPSIAAAAALPSSRSSPMVSTRRAPSASAAAKAKAPLSTSVKKTTAKKSVAAKSSAGGDVPTSSKKGLVVGGKFPSLGKLETDEGTFVDLDVSKSRKRGATRREREIKLG